MLQSKQEQVSVFFILRKRRKISKIEVDHDDLRFKICLQSFGKQHDIGKNCYIIVKQKQEIYHTNKALIIIKS